MSNNRFELIFGEPTQVIPVEELIINRYNVKDYIKPGCVWTCNDSSYGKSAALVITDFINNGYSTGSDRIKFIWESGNYANGINHEDASNTDFFLSDKLKYIGRRMHAPYLKEDIND